MGFWMRFGGWVIDGFAVWIILFVISSIIARQPLFNYFGGGSLVVTAPATLLLPLAFWLYYWLFTGLKGQTPGKMLVGIKVVDEQGNIPGLGRAALREVVGKIISSIPLYLGFFWIGWDRQKQGWHDKLATTYVVRSRRD